MIDEILAGLAGRISDVLRRLPLGPHHQHATTGSGNLAHGIQRPVQQRHRLA